MGCEDSKLMELAQDSVQCGALISAALKPRLLIVRQFIWLPNSKNDKDKGKGKVVPVL
jgi:hypothetical protein